MGCGGVILVRAFLLGIWRERRKVSVFSIWFGVSCRRNVRREGR